MADSLQINGVEYTVDLNSPIDISIPLRFNGLQPNAYGVAPATSKACEYGELVGDTRRGGSVNFEQYTFIPHCNGTHTECVGHITNERISVRDCLKDVFIPAFLVSVEPAVGADESYVVSVGSDDRLITRESLQSAILSVPSAVAEGLTRRSTDANFRSDHLQPPATAVGTDKALIVRTLPNDDAKLIRQYGDMISPYFSTEAMQYIIECGFKHLLVDLPSIDRIYDEGKLSNHRIFWNVEPGSFETNDNTRLECTITELIYVPNEFVDGEYLLNLQIAPFEADASPSRPVLFRIS